MSTAVVPSAGSLTNTGKRGSGGGKPPRKPGSGKGGPAGHYDLETIKALCE